SNESCAAPIRLPGRRTGDDRCDTTYPPPPAKARAEQRPGASPVPRAAGDEVSGAGEGPLEVHLLSRAVAGVHSRQTFTRLIAVMTPTSSTGRRDRAARADVFSTQALANGSPIWEVPLGERLTGA